MATTLLIKRTDPNSPGPVLRVFIAVFVVTAIAASAVTVGQTLRDPMQPPTPGPVETGGVQAPVASSGLQIVRSSGGKRTAFIDGTEVRVGTKIAGSTVVALSESAATLRDEEGHLTSLSMYPGIEKRPITTTTDAVVSRPARNTNKKNQSQ